VDEKRVWGLKKIGTLIDCDVLGRAAASEATTAAERVLHPHLLQLLGIVVESLGAACVLAAVLAGCASRAATGPRGATASGSSPAEPSAAASRRQIGSHLYL
jgi:hypothetical protein